jgi:hypothetical protein
VRCKEARCVPTHAHSPDAICTLVGFQCVCMVFIPFRVQEQLRHMKQWLSTEGSPKCSIDQAIFNDLEALPASTFDSFSIRH